MSIFSRLFSRSHPVGLEGFVDWHCHLLPGVDDGVSTMEEALDILELYEQIGATEIWLTPHIMEDIPNATGILRERFHELTEAYSGPIRLRLAAENMIDALFYERLEADDLLPIGDGEKMLLVETSYFNAPLKFRQAFEMIKSHGYFPLLAHPERYNYITSLSTYRELKQLGVRFQLNLLSLSGHYGPIVRDKARRLLEAGLYDRIGSDLHHIDHLHLLRTLRLPHPLPHLLTQLSENKNH